MEIPQPPPFHIIGAPPPPAPPAPPAPPPLVVHTAPARRRRRVLPIAGVAPFALGAALLGVLLGSRAAAEDGRSAAAAALASGDAARAVTLYQAVASRSGFLMVFDPGAAAAAEHDAQAARIAWARQLASAGQVDAAVATLRLVSQPSLLADAEQARAHILIDAATAAAASGHATLAISRLDEAERGNVPASLVQEIAAMRGADEVKAAAELVAANRAADALSLLDDAAAHGSAAAAAAAYPATLLAAANAEISDLDFVEAAATLQRLVSGYRTSPQARTARSLLAAPQPVFGSLVDTAGHGASGRVRLSTHYTQIAGGYVTSGPFYYGNADADGDFTVASVPVGGPYVLEYFRDGGWMTLVDPRTDQPANPVMVKALTPEDLAFIVLP